MKSRTFIRLNSGIAVTKKILLAIIFTVCSLVEAHSQVTFSGNIIDTDNSPLGGAQIILSADSNAIAFASADSTGHFMIKNLSNGTYNVEVSLLGYAPIEDSILIENNAEKNFMLKEDSKMLDSVVIISERPRLTTANGHIYYLSKAAQNCGNPFKALQEIPELLSNNITQTVSSTDGQPLMVLVDGMQVNSGIAPIDPKRIDYVEINDIVSAKYLKKGVKRILNIHLKPQKTYYSFYEYGLRNDYPLYWGATWGKLEIGNDKLSVYMDVSPEYSHNQKSHNEGCSKNDNYYKTTDTDTKQCGKAFEYTLLVKLKASAKDYLAAYFQGRHSYDRTKTDGTGTYDDYTYDDNQQTDNGIVSSYYSKNRSNVFAGTLYHKHTFNEKTEIESYINGTYNYNNLKSRSTDLYQNAIWEDISLFKTRKKSLSLDISLEHEINENMYLAIGSSTSYTNDKLEDLSGGNPVYRHEEYDEYLFSTLQGKINRFNYMVSAGFSAFWRETAGINDHYYRPYVASSFTFDLKALGSLRLGYILNSASPNISMLNPYNVLNDSLTREVGNPYLKPQQTHGASFMYSYMKKKLYAGISVNYNYITDRYEKYGFTDEKGIYITTYRNLGHYSNLSFNGMLRYRINNTLIGTSIEHTNNYFPGQSIKKNFSINGYVMQSLGKWDMYASVSYTNYDYDIVSRTRYLTPVSTSILISYNVNRNLTLSIGTEAVTKNLTTKVNTKSGSYESYILSKKEIMHPFFLLRWTLRKNQERKISLDNDIMKSLEQDIDLKNR